RFEWLLVESFYADDVPPFDPGALAKIPGEQWGSLVFVLDPSVRLFSSRWSIDSDPIEESPRHLLIHRSDGEVWAEEVGELKFALLEGIVRGLDLATLCAELKQDFSLSLGE